MARYLSDGSLDPDFGNSGTVVSGGSSGQSPYALAVSPDGSMLVAGEFYPGTAAIRKYTVNGSADVSFGSSGVVTYQPGTQYAYFYAIEVLPSGLILAAGGAGDGRFDQSTSTDARIARYLPDGSLDPSFGSAGIESFAVDGSATRAGALLVLADGRFLVGGEARIGGRPQWIVRKFNADGSVEESFGDNGNAKVDFFGLEDRLKDLIELEDGRFLLTGVLGTSSNYQIGIARLTADGSLDESFGDSGKVRFSLPAGALGSGCGDGVVDAAGRILIGCDSGGGAVALVRFSADGDLDSDFGDEGIALADFNSSAAEACDLAVAPSGAIVVVGMSYYYDEIVSGGSALNFAIARFENGDLCGDGVRGDSEDCDDGNTDDGDCCSSTCTFEAAGSTCLDDDLCNGDETCDGAGTCDAGTPLDCDDGNICTADTCLAATGCESTPEPVATSCADSDLCNGDETCDGAGSCDSGAPLDCADGDLCTQDSCDPNLGCQNAAEPANMCLDEWGKGSLLIKETVAGKEKLIAKLVKGPEILFSDFGDPTDSLGTDYQACLYDDAGSYVGALDLDQAGLACGTKACWRGLGPRGFIYKDSAAAASGIKQLRLMAGADGKSMIKLIAGNKASKGQDQLPTGLSEGLVNASGATLQLFGTDAPECFSIDFTRVRKQESHVFSALK